MLGVGAYTLWGLVPIYFHAVAHITPLVVVCHRIVWSSLFLALIVCWRREWRPIWGVASVRRNVLFLLMAALLIAINWLVFIYAITTRQVLQASLGYFINPLLSVALGLIFLGERLRPGQWLALFFAGLGVLNLAVRAGAFPWIALSLATSFALYGLVRKTVSVHSLHGLLIETLFLLPPALIWLLLGPSNRLLQDNLGLLSLSGLVTAVPLLMFGAAVRCLRLSTLGFLQYVGPSIQFFLALVFFREPLDLVRFVSFSLCWLGIVTYLTESVLTHRAPVVADRPE